MRFIFVGAVIKYLSFLHSYFTSTCSYDFRGRRRTKSDQSSGGSEDDEAPQNRQNKQRNAYVTFHEISVLVKSNISHLTEVKVSVCEFRWIFML